MSSPPPGIPTVDVQEAERRRADGAVLVDVREPNELEAVRVEGAATFVPLSQFAARWQDLPTDRPLLMLCNSGSRSAAATAHLLRNGYADVTNVAGGIVAWQRAGLPVRNGPLEPGEGDLPR